MGVLSGGHSTLGILFILSLELLSLNNVCNGLLEVYEKGKTTRMMTVFIIIRIMIIMRRMTKGKW